MKSLILLILLVGTGTSCVTTQAASIRRVAESHLDACLRMSPGPVDREYREMCYIESEEYCKEKGLEKGCGEGGGEKWITRWLAR